MERVVNYIKEHGSAQEPVPNREIASQLHMHEQEIRKKINKARQEGIPICACAKGYFYSEEKDDVLNTIQSLMHRTISVEKAVNGLLTVLRGEKG